MDGTADRQRDPALNAAMRDFRPRWVSQVELGAPLPDLMAGESSVGQPYQLAQMLVRLHSQPIGAITLPLGDCAMSRQECARSLWQALGARINAHLCQDGLPEVHELPVDGLPRPEMCACTRDRETLLRNAPFVSVVVATHDRPQRLAVCLESLLALEYPDYEIVVVDNAPSSDATAELVRTYGAGQRIRYLRENRAGLAIAHNCGLREVKAPIVAFTDDDVRVDRYWLAELVRSFALEPGIGCVTGLVLGGEIETISQAWIEQGVGFGKGFEMRIFDLERHRPRDVAFPYTAGKFGSGANMAFQTEALRSIGGFDPALGAGTVALGGDDLAIFFTVVARGFKLVYQPSALVHHWHRRDYESLRRQSYGYGAGLTAYLTSVVLADPRRLLDLALRLPAGLAYFLNPGSPKNDRKPADYPHELSSYELRGMLYGPLAYLRSHRRVRGKTTS